MTKPPRKPSCDDYEVGYRKPPSRTRFRKGTSGNPRAKQKGVRNLGSDVKRTLWLNYGDCYHLRVDIEL